MNLAPNSKITTFHMSKPTPYVADRQCAVPVGNILGGGSSINLMAYTRPADSDYDNWSIEGWTFQDLVPLFKKVKANLGCGLMIGGNLSC
jgi:alcohol oxidase